MTEVNTIQFDKLESMIIVYKLLVMIVQNCIEGDIDSTKIDSKSINFVTTNVTFENTILKIVII